MFRHVFAGWFGRVVSCTCVLKPMVLASNRVIQPVLPSRAGPAGWLLLINMAVLIVEVSL